jgi:hypothetical protein
LSCLRCQYRCSAPEALRVAAVRGACRPWLQWVYGVELGNGGICRIRGVSSADAELGKLRCGDLGGPKSQLTKFGWELLHLNHDERPTLRHIHSTEERIR